MKKISWPVWASLLGVVLVMFYFIWLSPLMSDNFVFSREIVPGYARFYSGEKIEVFPLSFGGSLRQACEMYLTWCGRFTGNLVVYLLFMLPHWFYCLFAASCFGLYALLLQICVFGRAWRQKMTPLTVLGIAALLWLAIPSFGEAFFWLSVGGQFALLGQAAILLPFRFALDQVDKVNHVAPPARFDPDGQFAHSGQSCGGNNSGSLVWRCILFFLAGIFVSSLDYPTSAAFPVTAICCALFVWYRNNFSKFPTLLASGGAGLCLGGVLTLAAPGNAQRLLLTRDPAVHAWLEDSWPDRFLDWLGHLPAAALMQWLPLCLLALGLYALHKQYGRGFWRRIPPSAGLFFLPALLIHGSYMMTAWPPPRAFAGSSALLLVCACIVLASSQRGANASMRRLFRNLGLVLAAFCACSLIYEGAKFYHLRQLVEEREAIIKSAKKSAVVPPMPPGSGDSYWVLGKYLSDLSRDPGFWVNRAMAAHYGLDEIRSAGGRTTNWRAPEAFGNVRLRCRNDVITISLPEKGKNPGKLHVYYYGEPALLCKLPTDLGGRVFAWLKKGGLRNKLVPILLARADIGTRPGKDGLEEGSSARLKLFSDEMFWLVRPGAGAGSFDLLPLLRIESPPPKS